MQMMKGTRTAIALATIAVTSTPGALAQSEDAPVGSALTALIDPAPLGAGQDGAEPSTAEIKKVVLELLQRNDGLRVGVFGESAGPALREIVEEGSLEQLTRSNNSNPIFLLAKFAPLEAIAFYSDAQRGPTFRYEALIRGRYGLDYIMDSGKVAGGSRNLLIDVLERTLASPTLDLDTKIRLSVAAHNAGLDSTVAINLIRENAKYASSPGRDWSPQIYDIVVPPGAAPPVDLPRSIATTLIDKRPSIDVLEPLSQSPHTDVRAKVAEAIRDEWSSGLLPRDRVVRILTRLAVDQEPLVIAWTTKAVGMLLSNDGVSLTIEDVTILVAGLANRPTDTANLSTTLAIAIHQTARRSAERDAAKIGTLYSTAYASRMTPLHEMLRVHANRGRGMPLSCAVAFFQATESLPQPHRQAAADLVIQAILAREAWSPARAAGALDALLSARAGSDMGSYILDSISFDTADLEFSNNNKTARLAIFKGLAPDRVPDAMHWLTSPDVAVKDQYALAFASVSLWPDAGPQLRAIATSDKESTRARVLAGAGLTWCSDVPARDVAAFSDFLAECLSNPQRRAEAELYFESRNKIAATGSTVLWNDITLALLNDTRVPDDFAVLLPLQKRTASNKDGATFEAVLDSAERRAQADASLTFINLSYYALEAMTSGRTTVRPALLRSWLLAGRYANSDVITVVLEMEDNDDWVALVLDDLVSRLRSGPSHRRTNVAAQILRLPGDEPVQQLLEFVMRSESGSLVEYVDTAISARLRIREASVRWSSLASGGTDLDTAKIKVMRLLESDNPAVKMAAIRGLGTLGAIEALPVLIELAGSDQPEVRDAALETLDLLHRQAATQATAAAGSDK